MKTLFGIFILLSLLVVSCIENKNKAAEQKSAAPAAKPKSDWWFSVKPSKYYYDFDSSKSDVANLDSGYIDTFSVNGASFRVFSNPEGKGDLTFRFSRMRVG